MKLTSLPEPPSSRKARSTYDSLVSATRAAIGDLGTVAPEAIADRAHVSQATFYSYFPSKNTALAAAFDAALEDLFEQVSAIVAIERLLEHGLESTMRDLAACVMDSFGQDAATFRLAVGHINDCEMINDVFTRRQHRAVEGLERFVRLGTEAGKIRSDDPRATAIALLASIQGYHNPMVLERGERVTPLLSGMLVALLRP